MSDSTTKKILTEWKPQQLLIAASDSDAPVPFLAPGHSSFTGQKWVKDISPLTALKVTKSGNYTYIAVAPIGSLQATAIWQVYCVEKSGDDTLITWADGNANFDNVATDLILLSYS